MRLPGRADAGAGGGEQSQLPIYCCPASPKAQKGGPAQHEHRHAATCQAWLAAAVNDSHPGTLDHGPSPKTAGTPAKELKPGAGDSAPISLLMLISCLPQRQRDSRSVPALDHPPSTPETLTCNYISVPRPQPRQRAGTASACLTHGEPGTNTVVWEPDTGLGRGLGPHSPVSFLKLCLQVSDPIPGPWVFLLQQVQAIDHCWTRWGWGRTEQVSSHCCGPGLRDPPGPAAGEAGTRAPTCLPELFQSMTFCEQRRWQFTKCVRLDFSLVSP